MFLIQKFVKIYPTQTLLIFGKLHLENFQSGISCGSIFRRIENYLYLTVIITLRDLDIFMNILIL